MAEGRLLRRRPLALAAALLLVGALSLSSAAPGPTAATSGRPHFGPGPVIPPWLGPGPVIPLASPTAALPAGLRRSITIGRQESDETIKVKVAEVLRLELLSIGSRWGEIESSNPGLFRLVPMPLLHLPKGSRAEFLEVVQRGAARLTAVDIAACAPLCQIALPSFELTVRSSG